MSEQNPSKVKHALNFGAILGLVLMILSLITYVFELYDQSLLNYVSSLLLIVGIIIGIRKYRDEANGGYISYGGALGYGVLVTLFASIIVSFVNYVYLGFIDDSFLQYSLEKAEMDMYDAGQPEEQIEMAMEWTRMFLTPGAIAIWGTIATTFFGFIISLIASAFLKKESDSFENS